ADQSDQTYLAVYVERRQAHEGEQQRPGNSQRHRTCEDDERIAKALELRRQDQVNEDCRQQKSAEELAALNSELARFASIVDREALGESRLSRVFKYSKRLIQRHPGWDHALNADGVKLLKFLQFARLSRGAHRRER